LDDAARGYRRLDGNAEWKMQVGFGLVQPESKRRLAVAAFSY
jgi:hypothetical protein